eukprot:70668-Amphidinium_carterae.1
MAYLVSLLWDSMTSRLLTGSLPTKLKRANDQFCAVPHLAHQQTINSALWEVLPEPTPREGN